MVPGTPLQAFVLANGTIAPRTTPLRLALFNEDGTPYVQGESALAGVVPAAFQADFAGADITALKVELNAFLDKLIAAGLMEAS